MTQAQKAILLLEDGRAFYGASFGADGETFGEVVFNTSMTGYQEILTDPSYAGQIVCMTFPQIGNYGINSEDTESRRPWAEGLIVKEASKIASNWRAEETLDNYLRRNSIVGLEGIDTRSLVRHIRDKGAMRAAISTTDLDKESLLKRILDTPTMESRELAGDVTVERSYSYPAVGEQRFHIAAFDFGIKENSLRKFAQHGCKITVFPAGAKAAEVLAIKPDGIFLSNGPGDPAAMQGVIDEIRKLTESSVPMFGICLGHQLIGSAFGGSTFKMKFGHRGGNQPVKDLTTGKIEIASHNHGFAVDADSLPADVEVTHINLNDNTVAGLRHKTLPVFSVQYHPESAPGPHDSDYLFERFIELLQN